ncbi:amidohydrolase family protein (plasmid) [Sphingobium sp. SJ10-10]|uniref:amidohydrolase family protein n=1 Tax=Sphingobium sp. SJ10-10 TaxID=3114999 RepID=UPI002E19C4D0|nr:amidohydrolase family protein [Sphingobium sp. SJ10-10]
MGKPDSSTRAAMRIMVMFTLLVIICATSNAYARCVAHPGNRWLSIRAILLTGDIAPKQGTVLIDPSGTIRCVGRACSTQQPNATRIDCPDALLSPGFINLHEHLAFGNTAPAPDNGLRYRHRHDWRKGLNGYVALENFQPETDPALIAWMELRHLLGGETSIVGGSMAAGLARNLDFHAGLEGLQVPRVTYEVFPFDDAAGIERTGDCDYGPLADKTEAVAARHVTLMHLGEGISEAARNEFRCATDPHYDVQPPPAGGGVSQNLLLDNVTVLHGVAFDRAMLGELARRKVDLVWSPRSNLSLYGRTLDINAALALGLTVSLGTDWLPSGSFTLGREAACARAYSDAAGSAVPFRTLWRMMTVNGAHAAHLAGRIGVLQPGAVGDVILVEQAKQRNRTPYEQVVRASAPSMLAIIRGGRILAGGDALLAGLKGGGCERIRMGARTQRICIAGDSGFTYAALQAKAASRKLWPAFFLDRPPVEPTCAALAGKSPSLGN